MEIRDKRTERPPSSGPGSRSGVTPRHDLADEKVPHPVLADASVRLAIGAGETCPTREGPPPRKQRESPSDGHVEGDRRVMTATKEMSFWCCCASNAAEEREKSRRNRQETLIRMDIVDSSNPEGTARNKVALLPGYSLMDWIRLGNSGEDLSGVGGAFLEVTEEELAAHNTQENAWISIRGKVYNATPYMGFHPGGIPELMKGVGKDATKLFTEIHPWVNYESILRKCLVGRLVRGAAAAAAAADFEKSFVENVKLSEAPDYDAGCRDESVFDSDIRMSWCQTLGTVRFVFQCRVSSPHVVVTLRPEYRLRILIRVRKKLHVFGFKLEKKVYWPCSVTVNTDTGRLEVELTKKEEELWNSYGANDKDHAMVASSVDEIEAYHKAKIVTITQATHNVRVFVFKFVEKVVMWVPVGHDVRIRAMIEGIDYAKQYTPIPPYLPHGDQVKHWHHDYVCCMVKYYSEGALTPYLFAKQERDIVEIGGMGGSFNIRRLSQAKELYLIAAGSGLSPMLRLIVWAVSKKDQIKAMNLLFVNRHEEDIIWRKELNDLSRKEKWFKVRYCLSQPGDNWKGLAGRVDDKMLDEFLPTEDINPDELPQFYVCACGPIQFAEMIQKYLTDRGYESWSHCFIG